MAKRTHEDAELTKQAILDSAFRLFSRRGYESTSLSDIARFAGVTRGAIYWHFKDKGQILVELCEKVNLDRMKSDALAEAADPREEDPLSKIVLWLKECGDDSSVQFYSSALFSLVDKIMSGACGSDDVRNKLKGMFEKREALVCSALRNSVLKKQLPADLNIEFAVDVLGSFICGFVEYMRMGKGEHLRRNYDRVVKGIISSFKENELLHY